MSVKARIIKIGNSRGVRIPKVLIDQVGFGEEVELEAKEDHLVIRPATCPRNGWEEAFRSMAEKGDDRLLDEPVPTQFDEDEWQW
ncbi:MAG: AbrB/MazE/SpoVT family DNA-binding domain-containing protein [Thermodesulfobacteriota bacterium]